MLRNQFLLALAWAIASLVTGSALAQEAEQHPPALTPEQERKAFQIADGLEARLFASEPVVCQPLTMTFDDRGRMWVIQYLQYPTPAGLKPVEVDQYLRTRYDHLPEPPPKGTPGIDRITILEDTDGDGVADKSKDFLNNLNIATGLALGYDGVFVANAPYLLFYPDRNHDDIPDGDPEVLLKGFGIDDAHAVVNSLTWGPDGWLYGAQGSTVTANINGIEFQQGIWRYHPITRQFELFAEGGGNTWGIDFDRRGQLFAGGNTREPLCHHVQGGYYVKGFSKHGPLHNPYSFGYFEPVQHNGFLGTALTGGFIFYNGGVFPKVYNDLCFYPNLRHNAVRYSSVDPHGSTFQTNYVGDLVTSQDIWFRPVDCTVGPDGAIYLADWYDHHIAHHDKQRPNQWYQPTKDDGRIWRIVPTGQNPRPMANLALRQAESGQLVDLLSHDNEWYARTARQILTERRDPAIYPRLLQQLAEAPNSYLQLQALWTLHCSGGLTEERALQALAHPDAEVRAWTVRLLGDPSTVSPAVQTRLMQLARTDTSVRVRSQLASTAKRLPAREGLEIVSALIQRSEDNNDPHVPLLIWWAIEDKAAQYPELVLQLLQEPARWELPLVQKVLLERIARRFAAEPTTAALSACARLLALAPAAADRQIILAGMNVQLAGRKLTEVPADLQAQLVQLYGKRTELTGLDLQAVAVRAHISRALADARATVLNPQLPEAERLKVVAALGEVDTEESLGALLQLLPESLSPAVLKAVLGSLERFSHDRIAADILQLYPRLPADVQSRAVSVLCSRKPWAEKLLNAIDEKAIPAEQVTLDQQRALSLLRDPELVARVEKRWGKVQPATAKQKADKVQNYLIHARWGTADASRGAVVFQKTCAACHKLHGVGEENLGPDLTQVERKSLDVLLLNIVDPSSLVRPEYVSFTIATTDGRVVNGMLQSETPETVTLIDAKKNKVTVARSEIDEMQPSSVSIMPENLLDPLDAQQLRDLIAFLQQEPKAAPQTEPKAGGAQ